MSSKASSSTVTATSPRWPSLFSRSLEELHTESGERHQSARSRLWHLVDSLVHHYTCVHAARYGGVSAEDCRDVASQVTLAIVQRLESATLDLADRSAGQLVRYFSAAAHKGLLQLFRRAGRQTEPVDENLPDGNYGQSAGRADDRRTETRLESREYAHAMRSCADALEDRSRRIWFFRVFYDMSSQTIAAHPEVALKAPHIDVILQRARDTMRDCMQQAGHDTRSIPSGVLTHLWRAYRLACIVALLTIAGPTASRGLPVQPTTADSLAARFKAEYNAGRFAEAATSAAAELEIRRRYEGEHVRTAECLQRLATAQWKIARFEEGEESIREALAIHERRLGPRSPEVGDCMNILGLLLMRQGRYGEAEQSYRRALSILRDSHGETHDSVASVVSNLGAVHEERWDLAGAEPYRRAALAMVKRLHGDEHTLVALAVHNLATLLAAQGDLVAAEALFREALELRERLLPPDHPDAAFSMWRLAETLYLLGDQEQAEPLLRSALERQKAALGDDHPRVAMTKLTLFKALLQGGKTSQSIALSHEMLNSARRTFGETSVDVGRALLRVAGAYRNGGQFEESELHARRAVELTRESKVHHWNALEGLGNSLYMQGDVAEAAELFEAAILEYEAQRDRKALGERRARFAGPFASLAACRLLLEDDEKAWPAVESSLGRFLGEELIYSLAESEGRALSDSLSSLAGDLESRIAVLRAQKQSGSVRRDLEVQLLEVQSQLGELEIDRRGNYPPAGDRTFPLHRIQRSLDVETAIVGWFDTPASLGSGEAWGYVISSRGPVHWIRLPEPGPHGPRLRRLLAGAASWPDRVPLGPRVDRLCRALGSERFVPLLPHLSGVKRIVVVSNAAMLGIPVELLIEGNGRSLGERFSVSYCVSATVWAWLEEARDLTRLETALVVGDVASEGEALPASSHETRQVGSWFPQVTTLAGPGARESMLAELASARRLEQFQVIHFSGHAKIDPRVPGRSALVLSAEEQDPVEAALAGTATFDGRVTAKEILQNWKLDAELVTLSACETALGQATVGEGYLGLGHTFFRVGARNLLVSLWRVDDEATALLMKRFYSNLMQVYENQGMVSKAEALQEAKNWLRHQSDGQGRALAHPAYWSGFVLMGTH